MEDKDKELVEKYCNNNFSESELRSVLKWFEESGTTPEGKDVLFNLWEELPEEEGNNRTDFDSILDKIHHKVNLAHTEKKVQIDTQDVVVHSRRKNITKIFLKAAAILLLPVLCFGLYMTYKYQSARQSQAFVNQAYNEVYSSVDAITKVSLPDGSNVWLNHNSMLRYPAMFRGTSRIVELQGEGYFEVAHNSRIPFIVKAGEIQVLATGTSFNILAYPNEDKIETYLKDGVVKLQRLRPDGQVDNLLKMKSTELAVYTKTNNEIVTRSVMDDRCFSWKDGKLIFNKEPMDEVVKKLGRWFNVDIDIKDPELLDLTYTATFIHETLPQVMELLTLVTPIRYSISNREIMSDGTFARRKVVLTKTKK